MAKGNMLLGYSRGSVGDITFYRDGGQQRTRARNRQPNNPRSNRQMYQRAKFAGAVKFYKQSLANFYKMAFENKKPNESDYNAFMRVNLAQSPLMSKTAFDKPGYPAIGHWTIAQGSMPTLQFFKNYGTGENKLAVVLPVQTDETISNNTTIGEFSTILINSGLYQQGDIFTMIRLRVDADVTTLATLPTATPEGNWNTYWFVTQIILDTADTRKIGIELLREDAGELIYKNSDGNIYIANGGDDGMSLVTTRNTPNGLKASNSEIVVTDTIDAAITTAEGDNYKNAVLADWRASGENILQGAMADPFNNPFEGAAVTSGYVAAASDSDYTNDLTFTAPNFEVQAEESTDKRFAGMKLSFTAKNEKAAQDIVKIIGTEASDYSQLNRDIVQLRYKGNTMGDVLFDNTTLIRDGVRIDMYINATGTSYTQLPLITENSVAEIVINGNTFASVVVQPYTRISSLNIKALCADYTLDWSPTEPGATTFETHTQNVYQLELTVNGTNLETITASNWAGKPQTANFTSETDTTTVQKGTWAGFSLRNSMIRIAYNGEYYDITLA